MLTLYDDVFSPYARKVRITLYEKGIPFERVRALKDRDHPDFLAANPRAEVPALVDDDFIVYDSTIICEYLEERWPQPPLYPRNPEARARCRQIEDLADTQLDAALYAVALLQLGRGQSPPAMRAAAVKDIERICDGLERLLEGRAFFTGDYSIADIAVFPHLVAAAYLGFPLDPTRHPHLVQWLDRVQQREAIVDDNADVLETLQRIQEDNRAPFDPDRMHWRGDRLEWVIKHGFGDWFMEEMRAGRAFFPFVR